MFPNSLELEPEKANYTLFLEENSEELVLFDYTHSQAIQELNYLKRKHKINKMEFPNGTIIDFSVLRECSSFIKAVL